jgi:hypothetical protein
MTRIIPAHGVYRSAELQDSLRKANPNDKLTKWITDMEVKLKENMLAGDNIGKEKIPKYYKRQYGVNNLYRYEHPEGYRSCYTILQGCVYILDIRSHTEYDRIFGY